MYKMFPSCGLLVAVLLMALNPSFIAAYLVFLLAFTIKKRGLDFNLF
jgi:hypothetical protein